MAFQRTKACCPASGFSLIELVVTISIVAILAGFAGPTMSSIITRHRVQDATTDLFIALIKARSGALMLNTDVSVIPIGGDWAAGWRIPDPSSPGKFLEVHEPVDAVSIRMSGGSSLTYQFNGRIRGDVGVRFSLSSTVGGYASSGCVAVDPSGRPYTKDGPCAG